MTASKFGSLPLKHWNSHIRQVLTWQRNSRTEDFADWLFVKMIKHFVFLLGFIRHDSNILHYIYIVNADTCISYLLIVFFPCRILKFRVFIFDLIIQYLIGLNLTFSNFCLIFYKLQTLKINPASWGFHFFSFKKVIIFWLHPLIFIMLGIELYFVLHVFLWPWFYHFCYLIRLHETFYLLLIVICFFMIHLLLLSMVILLFFFTNIIVA